MTPSKARERLEEIAGKIGLTKPLLQRARRRHRRFHERAIGNHDRQLRAQAKADLLRSKGRLAAANRQTRIAARSEHRAIRSHAKAQYWIARIKAHLRRLHKLERDQDQVEAELAEWRRKHGVEVDGNQVRGGTAHQRLRVALHTAVLNCARGDQSNYYSQTGLLPLYSHTLEGMPYGHRFDCSSFADGIYYVCGLRDPSATNFVGGYTGDQGKHGRRVNPSEAEAGDLVLYGPWPHHHVELVDDPARRTTIGHGSALIDDGIFDLFGDADYEIRSYV